MYLITDVIPYDASEHNPLLEEYMSSHITRILDDRKLDAAKRDYVSQKVILDGDIEDKCTSSQNSVVLLVLILPR